MKEPVWRCREMRSAPSNSLYHSPKQALLHPEMGFIALWNGLYHTPKWPILHSKMGFIVSRKALFRKPNCWIIYRKPHSDTACHLLFRIVILWFYFHIPVSGIAPKSPILLRMNILIRLKHIIREISLRFYHFALRLRKRLNHTERRLPHGRFPSFFFRISIYGWSFFRRSFCIIMQDTDTT